MTTRNPLLNQLSDDAAKAECKRLLLIVSAQNQILAQWFGQNDPAQYAFNEQSAFCMGMLSMFRYARGEDVPPPLVLDFIDELLKLMFCGLATDQMALPPFKRMMDKPWANAWRLAELRLALEGHQIMDIPTLAHLLGEKQAVLAQRLIQNGFDPTDPIPPCFIQEITNAIEAAQAT